MLQLGYVGRRDIVCLLPTTSIHRIRKLVWILSHLGRNDAGSVTSYGSSGNCGPSFEDTSGRFASIRWNRLANVPYAQRQHRSAGTGQTLNLVGLRPYSSPNCNPVTGAGCPGRRRSCVHQHLCRRYHRQLQLQLAPGDAGKALFARLAVPGGLYIQQVDRRWAPPLKRRLNPFNYRASRALSLFNSKQRFVISYDWDLPIPKYQGFDGQSAE